MPYDPIARLLRGYVRYAPGDLGKAALVGRHLDRRLREHPITTTARLRSGDRVPVSTEDVIQRYQYLFGTWEPHLSAFLRTRLRPGDTFVDVGAHRGAFSLLASGLVGRRGRVVAVEPVPQFHDALTTAATTNRRTNIRVVRSAVSDTHGFLTLYLEDPANLGHTTAVRPHQVHAQFRVPMAPLPDLLTENELVTARIIKIDAEGAEVAVTRGLLPALAGLRADAEIVMEVTPRLLAKQGDDVHSILSAMRAHGFRTYWLANDYEAASYPRAIGQPLSPVRHDESPVVMTDVVFSRASAITTRRHRGPCRAEVGEGNGACARQSLP